MKKQHTLQINKQYHHLFDINYPWRFPMLPQFFDQLNQFRSAQDYRRYGPPFWNPQYHYQLMRQGMLLSNNNFHQKNFLPPLLGPPLQKNCQLTSQIKIQQIQKESQDQAKSCQFVKKTNYKKNQISSATNFNLLNETKKNYEHSILKDQSPNEHKTDLRQDKKKIRKYKVQRYLQKKKFRNFAKKITYRCRKNVADQRIRFKGRFINMKQAIQILELDCNQEYSLEFIKDQLKKL